MSDSRYTSKGLKRKQMDSDPSAPPEAKKPRNEGASEPAFVSGSESSNASIENDVSSSDSDEMLDITVRDMASMNLNAPTPGQASAPQTMQAQARQAMQAIIADRIMAHQGTHEPQDTRSIHQAILARANLAMPQATTLSIRQAIQAITDRTMRKEGLDVLFTLFRNSRRDDTVPSSSRVAGPQQPTANEEPEELERPRPL